MNREVCTTGENSLKAIQQSMKRSKDELGSGYIITTKSSPSSRISSSFDVLLVDDDTRKANFRTGYKNPAACHKNGSIGRSLRVASKLTLDNVNDHIDELIKPNADDGSSFDMSIGSMDWANDSTNSIFSIDSIIITKMRRHNASHGSDRSRTEG